MHIPSLGPRGEGWVAGQLVLLVAIGAAGMDRLLHPTEPDAVRLVAAALGTSAIVAGAFIGLRGILDLGSSLTPFPRPADANVLVETGIYRFVRHPIYSGLALASIGWGIATLAPAAIALSVVLFAWFDLKARQEEAWLVERHASYRAYRAQTRKFIPFLY